MNESVSPTQDREDTFFSLYKTFEVPHIHLRSRDRSLSQTEGCRRRLIHSKWRKLHENNKKAKDTNKTNINNDNLGGQEYLQEVGEAEIISVTGTQEDEDHPVTEFPRKINEMKEKTKNCATLQVTSRVRVTDGVVYVEDTDWEMCSVSSASPSSSRRNVMTPPMEIPLANSKPNNHISSHSKWKMSYSDKVDPGLRSLVKTSLISNDERRHHTSYQPLIALVEKSQKSFKALSHSTHAIDNDHTTSPNCTSESINGLEVEVISFTRVFDRNQIQKQQQQQQQVIIPLIQSDNRIKTMARFFESFINPMQGSNNKFLITTNNLPKESIVIDGVVKEEALVTDKMSACSTSIVSTTTTNTSTTSSLLSLPVNLLSLATNEVKERKKYYPYHNNYYSLTCTDDLYVDDDEERKRGGKVTCRKGKGKYHAKNNAHQQLQHLHQPHLQHDQKSCKSDNKKNHNLSTLQINLTPTDSSPSKNDQKRQRRFVVGGCSHSTRILPKSCPDSDLTLVNNEMGFSRDNNISSRASLSSHADDSYKHQQQQERQHENCEHERAYDRNSTPDIMSLRDSHQSLVSTFTCQVDTGELDPVIRPQSSSSPTSFHTYPSITPIPLILQSESKREGDGVNSFQERKCHGSDRKKQLRDELNSRDDGSVMSTSSPDERKKEKTETIELGMHLGSCFHSSPLLNLPSPTSSSFPDDTERNSTNVSSFSASLSSLPSILPSSITPTSTIVAFTQRPAFLSQILIKSVDVKGKDKKSPTKKDIEYNEDSSIKAPPRKKRAMTGDKSNGKGVTTIHITTTDDGRLSCLFSSLSDTSQLSLPPSHHQDKEREKCKKDERLESVNKESSQDENQHGRRGDIPLLSNTTSSTPKAAGVSWNGKRRQRVDPVCLPPEDEHDAAKEVSAPPHSSTTYPSHFLKSFFQNLYQSYDSCLESPGEKKQNTRQTQDRYESNSDDIHHQGKEGEFSTRIGEDLNSLSSVGVEQVLEGIKECGTSRVTNMNNHLPHTGRHDVHRNHSDEQETQELKNAFSSNEICSLTKYSPTNHISLSSPPHPLSLKATGLERIPSYSHLPDESNCTALQSSVSFDAEKSGSGENNSGKSCYINGMKERNSDRDDKDKKERKEEIHASKLCHRSTSFLLINDSESVTRDDERDRKEKCCNASHQGELLTCSLMAIPFNSAQSIRHTPVRKGELEEDIEKEDVPINDGRRSLICKTDTLINSQFDKDSGSNNRRIKRIMQSPDSHSLTGTQSRQDDNNDDESTSKATRPTTGDFPSRYLSDRKLSLSRQEREKTDGNKVMTTTATGKDDASADYMHEGGEKKSVTDYSNKSITDTKVGSRRGDDGREKGRRASGVQIVTSGESGDAIIKKTKIFQDKGQERKQSHLLINKGDYKEDRRKNEMEMTQQQQHNHMQGEEKLPNKRPTSLHDQVIDSTETHHRSVERRDGMSKNSNREKNNNNTKERRGRGKSNRCDCCNQRRKLTDERQPSVCEGLPSLAITHNKNNHHISRKGEQFTLKDNDKFHIDIHKTNNTFGNFNDDKHRAELIVCDSKSTSSISNCSFNGNNDDDCTIHSTQIFWNSTTNQLSQQQLQQLEPSPRHVVEQDSKEVTDHCVVKRSKREEATRTPSISSACTHKLHSSSSTLTCCYPSSFDASDSFVDNGINTRNPRFPQCLSFPTITSVTPSSFSQPSLLIPESSVRKGDLREDQQPPPPTSTERRKLSINNKHQIDSKRPVDQHDHRDENLTEPAACHEKDPTSILRCHLTEFADDLLHQTLHQCLPLQENEENWLSRQKEEKPSASEDSPLFPSILQQSLSDTRFNEVQDEKQLILSGTNVNKNYAKQSSVGVRTTDGNLPQQHEWKESIKPTAHVSRPSFFSTTTVTNEITNTNTFPSCKVSDSKSSESSRTVTFPLPSYTSSSHFIPTLSDQINESPTLDPETCDSEPSSEIGVNSPLSPFTSITSSMSHDFPTVFPSSSRKDNSTKVEVGHHVNYGEEEIVHERYGPPSLDSDEDGLFLDDPFDINYVSAHQGVDYGNPFSYSLHTILEESERSCDDEDDNNPAVVPVKRKTSLSSSQKSSQQPAPRMFVHHPTHSVVDENEEEGSSYFRVAKRVSLNDSRENYEDDSDMEQSSASEEGDAGENDRRNKTDSEKEVSPSALESSRLEKYFTFGLMESPYTRSDDSSSISSPVRLRGPHVTATANKFDNDSSTTIIRPKAKAALVKDNLSESSNLLSSNKTLMKVDMESSVDDSHVLSEGGVLYPLSDSNSTVKSESQSESTCDTELLRFMNKLLAQVTAMKQASSCGVSSSSYDSATSEDIKRLSKELSLSSPSSSVPVTDSPAIFLQALESQISQMMETLTQSNTLESSSKPIMGHHNHHPHLSTNTASTMASTVNTCTTATSVDDVGNNGNNSDYGSECSSEDRMKNINGRHTPSSSSTPIRAFEQMPTTDERVDYELDEDESARTTTTMMTTLTKVKHETSFVPIVSAAQPEVRDVITDKSALFHVQSQRRESATAISGDKKEEVVPFNKTNFTGKSTSLSLPSKGRGDEVSFSHAAIGSNTFATASTAPAPDSTGVVDDGEETISQSVSLPSYDSDHQQECEVSMEMTDLFPSSIQKLVDFFSKTSMAPGAEGLRKRISGAEESDTDIESFRGWEERISLLSNRDSFLKSSLSRKDAAVNTSNQNSTTRNDKTSTHGGINLSREHQQPEGKEPSKVVTLSTTSENGETPMAKAESEKTEEMDEESDTMRVNRNVDHKCLTGMECASPSSHEEEMNVAKCHSSSKEDREVKETNRDDLSAAVNASDANLHNIPNGNIPSPIPVSSSPTIEDDAIEDGRPKTPVRTKRTLVSHGKKRPAPKPTPDMVLSSSPLHSSDIREDVLSSPTSESEIIPKKNGMVHSQKSISDNKKTLPSPSTNNLPSILSPMTSSQRVSILSSPAFRSFSQGNHTISSNVLRSPHPPPSPSAHFSAISKSHHPNTTKKPTTSQNECPVTRPSRLGMFSTSGVLKKLSTFRGMFCFFSLFLWFLRVLHVTILFVKFYLLSFSAFFPFCCLFLLSRLSRTRLLLLPRFPFSFVFDYKEHVGHSPFIVLSIALMSLSAYTCAPIKFVRPFIRKLFLSFLLFPFLS